MVFHSKLGSLDVAKRPLGRLHFRIVGERFKMGKIRRRFVSF